MVCKAGEEEEEDLSWLAALGVPFLPYPRDIPVDPYVTPALSLPWCSSVCVYIHGYEYHLHPLPFLIWLYNLIITPT